MIQGKRPMAVAAAVLLCFAMILSGLQTVKADSLQEAGTRIRLCATKDTLAGFEKQKEKVAGKTYRIQACVKEKTADSKAEFDVIAAEDIFVPSSPAEDLFCPREKLYSAGETVEILQTDQEGMSLSKALPAGKYLVQQTIAREGYLKADAVSIDLSEPSQKIQEIFLHSEAGDVVYCGKSTEKERLTKDTDEVPVVTGPKVLQEDVAYGIFATKTMRVESDEESDFEEDSDFETESVTLSEESEEAPARKVMKGTLLGVATAKDGEAAFTTVMPEGSYAVRKLQTKATQVTQEPDASEEKTSDGKTNEQNGELQNGVADEDAGGADATDSSKEENKETKKYVLRKTDINGIALEGAEFGMYAAGDNKKVLKKAVSDKKGMVVFDNLQEGEFVIRELAAPKGYELSHEIKKIRVTQEWKNQAEHEIRNFVNRTAEDQKADTQKTKKTTGNTEKKQASKPVKTGDMRIPLWKWIVASAATLAVVVGLICVCRRRQRDC